MNIIMTDDGRAVIPAPRTPLPFGGGTPATPCPSWCAVGTSHEDGDHFHYGRMVEVGSVKLSPEIREDDSLVVMINVEDPDNNFLSISEVDELIAKLTEARATLIEFGSANAEQNGEVA